MIILCIDYIKIMFKIINNFNQQKIFQLFYSLLLFKRFDKVLILKILLKFTKIRNKTKNLRHLLGTSLFKPYNHLTTFFEQKFHKVKLIQLRKLSILTNIIDLFYRLFFNSNSKGKFLVFNLRIYSLKIIYKQFEFYKKNYSLKLILENKLKLKFSLKSQVKYILFENKNTLFKKKLKIVKKKNESLLFKNEFSFKNFFKNKKDILKFKSFRYFHSKDHTCFKILKFFSIKVGKTCNLFLKIDFKNTISSLCQSNTISSKIWAFYHEVFAVVIKQTPKTKFLKNYLDNLVKNYETLEKNLICINNILYIKLEMLGKGGSGKIYKILRQDKKIFALKKNKIGEFGAQIIQNFVNEITILKLLSKKSKIIRIKAAELNFKKSLIFIILECGEYDLDFFLKTKKKSSINFSDIKGYWKQILKGVQELHEERIVHGDLKPGNFLFIKNNLKLIDFGISRLIENNSTNITRDIHVGTLNYMSPEAILEIPGILENIPNFKTSRSSDIWSLGCILFQLSQGDPPFKNFPMIQKIHAIVNNAMRMKYEPASSPQLIDIIKNCLRRNPDFRPTIFELTKHSFFDVF